MKSMTCMKSTTHLVRVATLCLALLGSQVLLAHNTLTASSPADGAVLDSSPETIELSFSDGTYLDEFELLTAQGEAIELDFSPSLELSAHYSIEVPPLADGEYTVKWTVEGSDTHRLNGEFSFKLTSSLR